MKTRFVNVIFALGLSAGLVTPTFARGFGGGFHGGGGGFGGGGFHGGGGGFGGGGFHGGGGGFGGGGFHGGGGGFEHGAGASGFDHGGSFNGAAGGFQNKGFAGGGGGFGSIAGTKPMESHGNFSQFHPSQLPTDGGMGGVAGAHYGNGHSAYQGNLSSQGARMRNSFNGNDISHTTNINNFNHYGNTGGYHANGYGANGYHPYGGYGAYHPYAAGYGAGYHAGSCWGYPGAWNGCTEAAMWTCAGTSMLTSFLGLTMMASSMGGSKQAAAPTNITYEGDNVYINGQPSGYTSQQYYQQAQQLATSAPSAPMQQIAYAPGGGYQPTNQMPTTPVSLSGTADKWEPLGVFSLAEPGQSESTTMLQLAINQQGVVEGNYLNQITNEKALVHGALDKQTQRISWTVGDNPSTVFDTDFSTLMKDDSTVLVHFGPNSTQQMALIRLPEPKETASPQDQMKAPQSNNGGSGVAPTQANAQALQQSSADLAAAQAEQVKAQADQAAANKEASEGHTLRARRKAKLAAEAFQKAAKDQAKAKAAAQQQ